MYGYFEIIYMTLMNDDFLLDVGVIVCPLNSKLIGKSLNSEFFIYLF
jgi:hypothetical protein